MKNILITGVAGFIGMHTAIKFLKNNYNVFGIDNINDYYSVNLKKQRILQIENIAKEYSAGWKFFKADINSNVFKKFSKINIDAVIHLAAQAGVRYSIINPTAYINSNILGLHNFSCILSILIISSSVFSG